MMKLKSVAMAICSMICVGATYAAVEAIDAEYVTANAVDAAVDISDGVTISGWSTSAELKLLTISFDKNVLSNFDYDAMDTEEFAYIQDYLCFNGKTVREINADTTLGALNWEYTQFPGNASDKYKVPVLIYERDAARLRLYIHENYFNALGDNVTFELKAGLQFVNDEGATYVMGKNRAFSYADGAWTAKKEGTDVTSNVKISGWVETGTAQELICTYINFGAGVIPSNLGYHVLDSDIGTQYHYVKNYITINGKTIGQINEETDVSSYVFSSFPSTAADKYKLPVILFGNGDNLELKIHKDYIASLGDGVEIVVGVKAGMYFENGAALYQVNSDLSGVVREGTQVTTVDVTANVTVEGWNVTGDAQELTYTRLSFGAGVMPAGVDYGIMDKANYMYLQDYITINGKTVREINAQTDVSGYNFATFPSSASATYKVPVIIYVNGDKLEIKVHNNYVATLGEDQNVVIGVKPGAYIENGKVTYTVTQDVAVTVREAVIIMDVTENVTIGGWKIAGDLSELTRTVISFGAGVMPADVDYGIMDKAKYGYLQDYITINGKTVREINAETDVSNYVFHTFPSTAADKYKVPVIIYVNGDNLEVKIHNDYLAALGGNIDVIVGVKAGASIQNGNATYSVSSDVQAYVRKKAYTLTVELGQGVNEEYIAWGGEIALETLSIYGYTFNGWLDKQTGEAALTVMPERDYVIYASLTAIEYKVIFMDGETVVDEVIYTLDNTQITEPAVPTKDGYTSAWETYELKGGDVIVNIVYTEIELPDSSTDSSDSSDASDSVDSSSDSSDSSDSADTSDSSTDSSDSSTDTSDSVSDSTSDSDSSVEDKPATEKKSGCAGAIGGLSIGALGFVAVALLKKKENE